MMAGIDDGFATEFTKVRHRFVRRAPVIASRTALDGMPAPWIPEPTQARRSDELEIPETLFCVTRQFGDVDPVVIAQYAFQA